MLTARSLVLLAGLLLLPAGCLAQSKTTDPLPAQIETPIKSPTTELPETTQLPAVQISSPIQPDASLVQSPAPVSDDTDASEPAAPSTNPVAKLVAKLPGAHLVPNVFGFFHRLSTGQAFTKQSTESVQLQEEAPVTQQKEETPIEQQRVEPAAEQQMEQPPTKSRRRRALIAKKVGLLATKKVVGGVIATKLAAPILLKTAKVAALASLLPVKLAAKGAVVGALIAKPILIKSALIGAKTAKIAALVVGPPLIAAGGLAAAGVAAKKKLTVAGVGKTALAAGAVAVGAPKLAAAAPKLAVVAKPAAVAAGAVKARQLRPIAAGADQSLDSHSYEML